MATDYHAEHVGSLLRPPELLGAREAHARGSITPEQLREVEDRAVLDAIYLQRQAGMEVFTDGEMRRGTWMAWLLESLGGVVPQPGGLREWHRDRGGDPPAEDTKFAMVSANEKLSRRASLVGIEAEFLAGHAPGRYKVTMMSAAMGSMLWRRGVSDHVYPTQADLLQDVVALQVEEIEDLLDRGVTWIQLDSLVYNQVIDARFRVQRLGMDVPPETILDQAIRVDSELVRAARRKNPQVTVGMHFCRGNNRSAWMAEGSYEPVAERLFSEVGVDRFLLEYDSDRAGGFEPVRFVPRGTTVVLGLVSSKFPELESRDELRRRVEEASKHVAIEDLALSPQCGFASTAAGNLLTLEQERRKLELVAEIARQVWG